jgi:hypothetical protein
MNWYELTRRDVVGLVVAVAIVGALLWASFVTREAREKTNWGFGPEWECSNPLGRGGAGPICFKRAAGDEKQPFNDEGQ